MKILQVAPFPQRRGAEIFADTLNSWLEQQGHEVFTLFLYHYIRKDALRLSSPYTCAMANYRSPLEKVPGINPRPFWFLNHTVNLVKPDILQVNGGRALKYGALLRKLSSNQFSLVYRSIGSPRFWEKGRVGRTLARIATSSANAVVAVSEATLAEFSADGTSQVRRRIHRGSDLEALRLAVPVKRESLDTPPNSKVLIYVGSLSFEKCPIRAIEVLRECQAAEPETYLWMVGNGPLLNECQERVHELGLRNRVRFLGTVPEVGPYLKAADVHLLTSDTEGLPGCVVESSALGIPCVAADVGGVKEIVLHEKTGFIVPPSEIVDYAHSVQRLLSDNFLYERFSRKAMEWSENFSIDQIGPQYLALYQDLLKRKAR